MKNIKAKIAEEQKPAPKGKTGKWIAAPEIDENCFYYQLNVKEMDFEKIDPQPVAGGDLFAENGHLYCGADSEESANEIFNMMIEKLVLEQTPIKEKPKKAKIITLQRNKIVIPRSGSKYFK